MVRQVDWDSRPGKAKFSETLFQKQARYGGVCLYSSYLEDGRGSIAVQAILGKSMLLYLKYKLKANGLGLLLKW
jgi:hypothetical protein